MKSQLPRCGTNNIFFLGANPPYGQGQSFVPSQTVHVSKKFLPVAEHPCKTHGIILVTGISLFLGSRYHPCFVSNQHMNTKTTDSGSHCFAPTRLGGIRRGRPYL